MLIDYPQGAYTPSHHHFTVSHLAAALVFWSGSFHHISSSSSVHVRYIHAYMHICVLRRFVSCRVFAFTYTTNNNKCYEFCRKRFVISIQKNIFQLAWRDATATITTEQPRSEHKKMNGKNYLMRFDMQIIWIFMFVWIKNWHVYHVRVCVCACVFESVPISMPMHTCSSYINSHSPLCMLFLLVFMWVWVWQCNTPITFCHTLVEGLQQTHTHHTSLFHSVQQCWINTNGNQNTYRLFCFIDIKTCMRCDFISFFISLPQFFLPNFDELKLENKFFQLISKWTIFQPTRTQMVLTADWHEEKKYERIKDAKNHNQFDDMCIGET